MQIRLIYFYAICELLAADPGDSLFSTYRQGRQNRNGFICLFMLYLYRIYAVRMLYTAKTGFGTNPKQDTMSGQIQNTERIF